MSRFVFGRPKSSKTKLKKSMLDKLSKYTDNAKNDDGFTYIDIKNPPFVLGGLIKPEDNNNEYYRLDATKKDEYSDANRSLAKCSAGCCVRFITDANEISLHITLKNACTGMHHFCDRGVYGVDAYIGTGTDRKYVGRMMQTFAENPNFNSGTLNLPMGINEVMINLPLYAGIENWKSASPKMRKSDIPHPEPTARLPFTARR
ncbi:MAG: hypothetical protein J6Q89_03340 [Clostridia bacterium]|nr:hypothetical protein [Clostridia bacterium]